MQAIIDSIGTATRYWSSFDWGGIASSVAKGQWGTATVLSQQGHRAGAIATVKHEQEIIKRMEAQMKAFQLLMNPPDEEDPATKTATKKAVTTSASKLQADALAKMGGAVTPGFDRAHRIRQEQLKILRDIEQNTDPNNPSNNTADIRL